ncbi:hypothetical protein LOS73_02335 [Pseudoalteromonas sp. SCSIO 43210]|mgnify:FL=1
MKVGSIHGRFQPFHNEHVDYALAALKSCDFLWIGITQYDIEELKKCKDSPNRGVLSSNPLTYLERINIIKDALLDANIDRAKFDFIPFPIDEPEKLYQFVDINTVCFTTIRESWNRAKVERLSQAGYKVEVLWENLEDKEVSSTLIRESLLNGNGLWKKMVQPSTQRHINSLDLAKRLQEYLQHES